MKKFLFALTFITIQLAGAAQTAPAAAASRSFFELRIYHFDSASQQRATEEFLSLRYLPFLHQSGIQNVGVFKPVGDDTAASKKLYLLIPYTSLTQFDKIASAVPDPTVASGRAFLNAPHDRPAFTRIESMLLKAFEFMPKAEKPSLSAPRSERIYELRSYESSSEKIFRNKVEMFNQGGEIALFKRLGFNAVFYSEAIIGPRMPNLVYMVSFNSMQDRDEHWKSFGGDPEWKRLSGLPQYQNNVSKIDTYFLRATNYSDL
ncbi:MAG TPA: NIPSNAP family protein [Flavisolibacter sp.]|jgi:hypothetical protein